MKFITVKEFIELLKELPEDVQEKEIAYIDFANCDTEEVHITLTSDDRRVIIQEG